MPVCSESKNSIFSYLCQAHWNPDDKHRGLSFLILLGLLPDIFFNSFLGNSGADASGEIAGYPNLSSPVFIFEPRELFEEKRRRNTFDDLCYSGWSNPRRCARAEVYMVWLAIYLAELYIVVARNGSEYLVYRFLGMRNLENFFTIFRWPCKVVPQFISCMACMFYCHVLIVTPSHSSPLLWPLWFPNAEHWGLLRRCQIKMPRVQKVSAILVIWKLLSVSPKQVLRFRPYQSIDRHQFVIIL